MKWWRIRLAITLVPALILAPVATAVSDPDSVSNNFRVVESQIGGSGDFNSFSNNYKFDPVTGDGGSTLGEAAIGNSASNNFQTNGGFNTTQSPALTFVVNTPSISFGTLSSAAAVYRTATFDVTNYTTYGYVVQVIGTPPTYAGNPINALTTDSASAAGTEQFGINLVNNPTAVQGANPAAPSGGNNSQGVAGDGTTGTFGTTRPYTQPDKFRFNSGEFIASANKDSGATRFTMTLMANISTTTGITPGSSGYQGELTLVATGTY